MCLNLVTLCFSALVRLWWAPWSLCFLQSTMQLLHRDQLSHMILLLSSIDSVSPVPRQAEMKVLGPSHGMRRRSVGGFQRLLPPWGVCGAVGVDKCAGLGFWIDVFLEVDGVPGKSFSGAGTCVQSRLR